MSPMVLLTFSLLLVVQNNSMKINLQGSLSLGKDILSVLENYALQSQMFPGARSEIIPSRRSGHRHKHRRTTDPEEDYITVLVKSQNFCQHLPICESRDVTEFLNGYIIILVHAVEKIIDNLNELGSKFPMFAKKNYSYVTIFHHGCKSYLEIVQDCLSRANRKMTIENKFYTWITLLKRISATLQIMGIQFIESQFHNIPVNADISEIKDQLTQRVVTSTVSVEEKYIMALCNEYQICSRKFYCTNALKSILEQLTSLGDDRVSDFVEEFRDALVETNFYENLNHTIARDFKIILENIANPKNVALKEIFSTISKAVENRLRFINRDRSKVKTQDVFLFHSILSDMDHFYSKREKFPFEQFYDDFTTWSKYDGRLKPKLIRLFSDIAEQLTSEHEDIVTKLIQEVKAFLQVTIDIEQ